MDHIESMIVTDVARILTDDLLVGDLAPSLSCYEAEAMARLITLALGNEYALYFIREHASADEDEEDDHHNLWLEHQATQ